MRSPLFATLFLATQLAWGANLSAVSQMARENDASYAAARESWKAGQEKLPQGKALLRPSVNLSGWLRRNEVDSSTAGNLGYNTHGYALSLSQPLYRKQNLETYEQAKLQVLQAEQNLHVAEQDLLLRTSQAYFDILQAHDNLETARAQKQAYAEQLAQAKKSFEVGAATITDTHEAQARYDLTTAQEIAALNDLEVKQRALEKIIQREAPALAALNQKAVMSDPDPVGMEHWVKRAENDNLAVLLAQTGQELARRELEKQKGGHHPTLDLSATYSDSRNQASGVTTGIDTKTGVIGLELAIPLYLGGGTDSRIREAAANLEKTRFDLESARRQAALGVRQAYLGVISGAARVKALEQALISSEAQLKSTKLGLEVGVRTRVDVLNAQQQVYTTRKDLSAARYQTLLAGLTLKASVGALRDEDMKELDKLLVE